MEKTNKPGPVSIVFEIFFSILLLGTMILSIVSLNWRAFIASLFTILISLVPFVIIHIADKKHIKLPHNFEIVVLLFIFATLYLGEIRHYYNKFFWWDILVHLSFGIIFASAGFYLVQIINTKSKDELIINSFFVIFFSFGIVMVFGLLWEAFEFSMDAIFGTNLLLGGLRDTIGDLVADISGAAVSAAVYYYRKKRSIIST